MRDFILRNHKITTRTALNIKRLFGLAFLILMITGPWYFSIGCLVVSWFLFVFEIYCGHILIMHLVDTARKDPRDVLRGRGYTGKEIRRIWRQVQRNPEVQKSLSEILDNGDT